MRRLFLSDDGHPVETAAISRRHKLGIEVQAFYDPALLEDDPRAVEKHREALGGLSDRALHGCFGDLCPGSFDRMVREVARNRFELSHDIARRLGAQHLILHHGYVPHTSPPATWLKRCTKFWQDFLADKNGGIRFHIENMLELDPGLLADLIDAIGRPWVDANLDIGHVHCNATAGLETWIRGLGSRIGYAHLHDNHGGEDEHLAFGKGTLPLKETLLMLEEVAPSACWCVEVNTECLEESLGWLERNGFAAPTTGA